MVSAVPVGCCSFEKTQKQSTCPRCQTVLTLSCYKCDTARHAADPPQVQSMAEKMAVEARSEEMLKKIQDYLSQATEQVWVWEFVALRQNLLMFTQTLFEQKIF